MSSRKHVLSIAIVGVAVALIPGWVLPGVPCNVPGTHTTLQAAVDDAGCAQINLSTQVFTEEVVVSRSLSLDGGGATLSGGGIFRPLTIDGRAPGTITVSLTNLTLNSGRASSSSIAARNGGCLLIIGDGVGRAEVTASALRVSGCIASDAALSGFGGGIAVRDNATLDLGSSTISGNTANRRTGSFTGSGTGGGLYVRGVSGQPAHLSLTDSLVEGNIASYRMGGGGFAIGGGLRVQEEASAVTTNTTWRTNVARQNGSAPSASGDLVASGGAIAVTVTLPTASLDVSGDLFEGNVADASNADLGPNEYPRGGAISLHATNTAGQITATITDATMTGNRAKGGSGGTGEGRGGAIHARGATLVVERCTITGNRADSAAVTSDDGYGGGIYYRDPDQDSLRIVSSIISGNDSCDGVPPDCIGDGAQIFIDFSGTAAHVATLVHTTLADDTLNPKPALHFFGPTAGDELIVHDSIIANHAIGIQNTNATGWARGLFNLFDATTVDRLGTAFGDEATWINGSADFVDPAGGDYHIGSASDAIGLGRNVGTGSYTYDVTADVDGQPIVVGGGGEVDAGADQYGTSSAIFSDGFESGGVSAWSSVVG